MAVSLHGPAVLKTALARLDELSRLERDWDTYGALPLTQMALQLAEMTMRQVVGSLGAGQGERAAPYTVMPIADGGVSIEWRVSGAHLELDIGPNGDLSYLLVLQDGDGRQFEEGSLVNAQEALDLVRHVLGG